MNAKERRLKESTEKSMDILCRDKVAQARKEAFEYAFSKLCFLCKDGGGAWEIKPRREANGEWRHGLKAGNDLPAQPCSASELREKLMEDANE